VYDGTRKTFPGAPRRFWQARRGARLQMCDRRASAVAAPSWSKGARVSWFEYERVSCFEYRTLLDLLSS
jgi:hypothetical protein